MSESLATFEWPVRVYYEDTDAGGIVYNASYLRFMERSRTEWLRSLGITHGTVEREEGVQFVITRADMRFRSPARLDDELVATVTIERMRRASLDVNQVILRAGTLLCEALVTIACVDTERQRPRPLPSRLRGVSP